MKRLLGLLFFLLSFHISLFGQVNVEDSLALVALYESTDGDNWINNENWLTGPVESWFGVTVVEGRVLSLVIHGNGLRGSLPSQIGDLSALETLILNTNALSGSIPEAIGNLSNLEGLSLSLTLLTGSIPQSIGDLSKLKVLSLRQNRLDGTIPEELYGLSSLEYLYLNYNELIGAVSAELTNLNRAIEIHLNDNYLCEPSTIEFNNFTNGINYYGGVIKCDLLTVPPQDSIALVKLYMATDGDNWINNENWLTGDVDTWYGVTVEDERVTDIWLLANGLDGVLPEELSYLSELTGLTIVDSKLSGSLPTGLFDLTNLEVLRLHNNELSGTLQSAIGQLTKLRELDLNRNIFTGGIPEEIVNLVNLSSLILDQNSFDDGLSYLGQLDQIGGLSLNNNSFSGSFPESFTDLEFLSFLDLSANDFTGNLPSTISDLDHLQVLRIGSNDFSGVVPVELTNLPSLLEFKLADNPNLCEPTSADYTDWVAGLSNYENFNTCLYNLKSDSLALVALYESTNGDNWTNNENWLTGDVDTWFGITVENERVTMIRLQHDVDESQCCGGNNLRGTLPEEIGQLSELVILHLGGNRITGEIPSSIGNLSSLYELNFNSSNFTGSIPVEIGDLEGLGRLSLGGNELTGTIPASLGNLAGLEYLFLYSNQLSGSIPKELGRLPYLQFLNLENNSLSGSIPVELGNLAVVSSFRLNDNQLSGVIPKELGGLQNVREFWVNNNRLAGSLPEEMGNLPRLEDLRLDDNPLTGSIPVAWTSLANLAVEDWQVFDFSNTNLCELTDPVWTDWKQGRMLVTSGIICGPLDLYKFSIEGYDQLSKVDTDNNLITLNLPDVDLSSLVAKFEVAAGANVTIEGIPQISGTTSNDFTSSLTYVITSQDGTESTDWAVTITNEAIINGVIASEYNALVDFYNAAGGNNWSNNTNWLSQEPVDDWFGVEVIDQQVNKLILNHFEENQCCLGNNLSGVISPSLGLLASIKELNLSRNRINGVIPEQLGDLPELQLLLLQSNNLEGNIPSSLGQLTSLKRLELYGNKLSGPIPDELGNLVNLEALMLSENELTGTLPEEIGNLAELEILFAFGNELSGSIPESVGSLKVLNTLNLSENQLSGSIPTSVGGMTAASNINFSDNQLTGGIPLEIGNLDNLGWFQVANNELSGVLPDELSNLSNLINLNIRGNQFDGSIPISFVDLSRLGTLGNDFNYSNTNLCEPQDQLYQDWKQGRNIVGNDISCNELADILSFSIDDQVGETIIDSENGEINITMPFGTDIANLTADFTVSEGADTNTCDDISVSLSASKDTQVWSFRPTVAMAEGIGQEIAIYEWTKNGIPTTKYGMFDFDLSAIPANAEVIEAKLNLYHTFSVDDPNQSQLSGSNEGVIQRITSSWTELVTWGNKPQLAGENQVILPASTSEDQDYPNIDVTTLVKDMMVDRENSHGFNIKIQTEQYYRSLMFASSEHPDANLHPHLDVVYSIGDDNQVVSGITVLDYSSPLCLDVTAADGQTKKQWTIAVEKEEEIRNLISDSLALVALYESTDGDNWTNNDNWLTGPFSTWSGVSIENDRVTGLGLGGIEVFGELPPEIGNLTEIRRIDIEGASLYGDLPPEMINLKKLEKLDLEHSNLSGPLPSFLGELDQLENLNLGSNRFTGGIPENWRNLKSLNSLWIYQNSLSGTLPFWIIGLDELGINSGIFHFGETNLCEPTSISYFQWKETRSISSSGLLCEPESNLYSDSLALVALYHSTNGDEWTNNENWLTGPISSWYGVGTGSEGILFLTLDDNNLTGTLPSEMGDLHQLDFLRLDGNSISGEIPSELFNCILLETLWLDENNLSGAIPSEIGSLKQLTSLSLRQNELTGSIPHEIGNLLLLERLDLYENSLNGDIPDELYDLVELRSLSLDNNDITGSISTDISRLQKLESLGISGNKLSGNIPESIGSLTMLTSLSLGNNELSGQIPASLAELQSLRSIYLAVNKLTGSIPENLGDLTELESLELFFNDLSGEIPTSLGNAKKLKVLEISGNNLSGGLPKEIGSLTDLEFLVVAANDLSGTVPPELGNLLKLKVLSMEDNSFNGPLPKELGNMVDIRTLTMNHNNFAGELPEPWGSLTELRIFSVASNNLSGLVPESFTAMNKMQAFHISNNPYLCEPVSQSYIEWRDNVSHVFGNTGTCLFQYDLESDSLALVALYQSTDGDNWTNNNNWLTGDIDTWYGVTLSPEFRVTQLQLGNNNLSGTLPTEIGNLNQLVTLRLGINELTGEIPVEFSGLNKLETLDIFANQLTGIIPSSIGQLTYLKDLHLSLNQFSGTIPSELGDLTKLERLALVGNTLNGVIPEELGSLRELKRLELQSNQLTGEIPSSLSNLDNLEFMYLGDNSLQGEIPGLLANLPKIEVIDLGANQLAGSIPRWIDQLTTLLSLSLHSNSFSGPIPAELGQLANIGFLSLASNNLSGEIPLEIGGLVNLVVLNLGDNSLSGEIPSSLSQINTLESLFLGGNQLEGTLPLTSATGIVVSKNLLSNLPDMSNLNYLHSGSLTVFDNSLDFADIEPNIAFFHSPSSYSPQREFGQPQILNLILGEVVLLSHSPVGGTANSYQWYKDEELIEGATEEEYQIENLALESEGTYRLKVTNNLVPGLTLESHPIELIYEPRTEKSFLSYSVSGEFASADIDKSGRSITVYLPCDASDIASPSFELSGGAQSFVEDEVQVSEVTPVDFSGLIDYAVIAEDGSESLWTITVASPDPIEIFSTINHLSSCNTSGGLVTIDSVRLASSEIIRFPNSRYSLQWSNSSTNHQIEVTSEGTYAVEVIDNETGCGYSRSFEVLTKDLEGVLSLREKTDNTSCGIANGSLSVDVSIGSSQGLEYAWYRGSTATGDVIESSKNIQGLEAGNYTLVVTDLDTDCTTSLTEIIEDEQRVLDINLKSTTNTSCTAPLGTVELATITVNGDERISTLGYRIEWSKTENFENIMAQTREVNALASGTYYARLIGVTTECTSPVRSVTVVDDQSPVTFEVSATPNSRCDELGNGSAVLTALSANHEVQWYKGETLIQGQTSATISALTSGNYHVVVTDKTTGCEATRTFKIGSATPQITVEVATNKNTSCGDPDGSVEITEVSVNGVSASNLEAFSIEWWLADEDANLIQGKETKLTNILGGTYFVQVTLDSVDCQSALLAVTVEEDFQSFTVALAQSRPDLPGAQGTGLLRVNIEDTPNEMQISWYEGVTATGFIIGEDQTLENINAGDYTVKVTDSSTGCEVIATYEVGVDERSAQVINFDLPEIINILELPLTLSATSDQGLPVSFSIVEGEGVIQQNTLTSATDGFLTIKAYNEGTTTIAYAESIKTIRLVSDFYLTGTVTGAADASQVSGEVVVFTLDGAVFAQTSFTDGSYFIDGLPEGKYQLLIEVTGEHNTVAFDTYYNRQLLWNRATILTINDNTEVNVELLPKTLATMNGQGTISGKVVQSDGGSRIIVGRTLDGSPLEDIKVYLHSRDNNDVVAEATTDQEGIFIFENIPSGQYYFRIDAVGFDIADLGADIDYDETEGILEISAAIGTEGLTVEYAVVSGVEEELLKDISIYPNPVRSILHVEDVFQRIKSIQLLNLTGQLTRSFDASPSGEYDISSSTDGVYMMRVELDGQQFVHYKILVKD